MHGWLWGNGLTSLNIGLGSFGHADAEVGNFFVGHAVEVLGGWLARIWGLMVENGG